VLWVTELGFDICIVFQGQGRSTRQGPSAISEYFNVCDRVIVVSNISLGPPATTHLHTTSTTMPWRNADLVSPNLFVAK
jgi:hypothetical protein